jgi:hypothetical protein
MKDLWSLDRDAINHFLITRMCTTQDKDEYYGLLPYLKGFLTPEVITLFDHRFTLEELLNELEYLENKGIGKTSQPLSVMRNSDKSYVLTPNGLVLRNQPKTKTAIKRHL